MTMFTMPNPQAALIYQTEVQTPGRIELSVPYDSGSKVTVIVIREGDDFSDLTAAAGSVLGFWDNPYDDEDWNNA